MTPARKKPDLPEQAAKLTGYGVLGHLSREYGVHAAGCEGPNPEDPMETTPAIAVPRSVSGDEDYQKFLAAQGFERVERIGRGLFAWERTGEVYYGDDDEGDV